MEFTFDTPILLGTMANQYESITEWVNEEQPVRLIDLGAGSGTNSPYGSSLQNIAGSVTGIDPEESVLTNPYLNQAVCSTAEEFADGFSDTLFDTATALYVIEHLNDPLAFLIAARSVVRSGGSLFVLTPNRNHYFGLSAVTAARLRLQGPLLRLIRNDDDYHHPVAYRANTLHQLSELAQTAGFKQMEVRMIESPHIFYPYFTPRLHFLPRTYSRLVHFYGWTKMAGTMLVRLR